MREKFNLNEADFSFEAYRRRLESLRLDEMITARHTRRCLISERTNEQAEGLEVGNLNNEQFLETGPKNIFKVLDRIEADFQEREELIGKIRARFEAANKHDVVQRYFNVIHIKNDEGGRSFNDPNYIINQHAYSFSRGNLKFMDLLDLDELRKLDEELESLLKKVDPLAIEAKEKEIRDTESKERKKTEKKELKQLPGKLADIFYYKQKIFAEILSQQGIDLQPDLYDRKKFKNQINNLGFEQLQKIDDYYTELINITRTLGGDISNDEDLLLGLEELKDRKINKGNSRKP